MQELGFDILATKGTAAHLEAAGIPCSVVLKIQEGRPNAADLIKNGDIAMMMITSKGDEPDVRDGKNLRRLSLGLKVGGGLRLESSGQHDWPSGVQAVPGRQGGKRSRSQSSSWAGCLPRAAAAANMTAHQGCWLSLGAKMGGNLRSESFSWAGSGRGRLQLPLSLPVRGAGCLWAPRWEDLLPRAHSWADTCRGRLQPPLSLLIGGSGCLGASRWGEGLSAHSRADACCAGEHQHLLLLWAAAAAIVTAHWGVQAHAVSRSCKVPRVRVGTGPSAAGHRRHHHRTLRGTGDCSVPPRPTLPGVQVPIITTVSGAKATATALKGLKSGPLEQVPLQDYFPQAAERSNVEFKL